MIKKFSVLAVFFIFTSCAANRAVIRPDYDFSSVKTVMVGNFTSANDVYGTSGSAVQSAFIKYLLARGYKVVTDGRAGADVLIEGSVTMFQPDKKYLVRGPDREYYWYGGVYTSDIVEIGGSNVYDLGTAFGIDGENRIIASNATVGVYAYMTDFGTGEVVWSDSFTYEGLDLSSALDGVVKYIIKTLPSEKVSQEKK
ncbi:MAG: hypothetical protein LBR69_01715 [Endomicrobium sp.]|jgi:hypothetical protein|nr:hypothetical protein [Endomicrobium sp.]